MNACVRVCQLNAVQRRRLLRALAYAKVPEICAAFKRGEALAQADDLSGAISEFRQALRFDPAALAPSPPTRTGSTPHPPLPPSADASGWSPRRGVDVDTLAASAAAKDKV